MPPANMFVLTWVADKHYFKKTKRMEIKIKIIANSIKVLINVDLLHIKTGARASCLLPVMFSSLIWVLVTCVSSLEDNLLSCIIMTCVFFFICYTLIKRGKKLLSTSWENIKCNVWQLLNQKRHKLTTVKKKLHSVCNQSLGNIQTYWMPDVSLCG